MSIREYIEFINVLTRIAESLEKIAKALEGK